MDSFGPLQRVDKVSVVLFMLALRVVCCWKHFCWMPNRRAPISATGSFARFHFAGWLPQRSVCFAVSAGVICRGTRASMHTRGQELACLEDAKKKKGYLSPSSSYVRASSLRSTNYWWDFLRLLLALYLGRCNSRDPFVHVSDPCTSFLFLCFALPFEKKKESEGCTDTKKQGLILLYIVPYVDNGVWSW